MEDSKAITSVELGRALIRDWQSCLWLRIMENECLNHREGSQTEHLKGGQTQRASRVPGSFYPPAILGRSSNICTEWGGGMPLSLLLSANHPKMMASQKGTSSHERLSIIVRKIKVLKHDLVAMDLACLHSVRIQ